MQHFGRQLGRTRRAYVLIEQLLSLPHQRPDPRGISGHKGLPGLLDDPLVYLPEILLHALFHRGLRYGIAAIQARQDFHRILLSAQIHDDKKQILLYAQLRAVQMLSVKSHQNRTVAEGAALVHASAPGRGQDLPLIGHFHLAAHGHFQIIDPVEGAGHKNAYRGTGGKPFFHGKVCLKIVNSESPDVVVGHDLIGHPGDVAEKSPFLRFSEQGTFVHWDRFGPHRFSIGHQGGDHQLRGMGRHLSMDALVGARNQRVSLLDIRIDPPVPACPIGVLAKKTDAAGNENLHRILPNLNTFRL